MGKRRRKKPRIGCRIPIRKKGDVLLPKDNAKKKKQKKPVRKGRVTLITI